VLEQKKVLWQSCTADRGRAAQRHFGSVCYEKSLQHESASSSHDDALDPESTVPYVWSNSQQQTSFAAEVVPRAGAWDPVLFNASVRAQEVVIFRNVGRAIIAESPDRLG
jgi:hypothetical protein